MAGKTKRMISAVAYICAAIGAVVFLQQVFYEYSQGKTTSTMSQQPLSVQDIPTLTFCFWPNLDGDALKACLETETCSVPGYTDDIILKYSHSNTGGRWPALPIMHKELKVGENKLADNDVVIVKRIKNPKFRKQCYSLTHLETQSNTKFGKWFMKFLLEIDFMASNVTLESDKKYVDLWVTSEKNQYGVASQHQGRFLDGKVTKLTLQNDHNNGQYRITYQQIDQFVYLPWKCSTKSYYECVTQLVNKTIHEKYTVILSPKKFRWPYPSEKNEESDYRDTCFLNVENKSVTFHPSEEGNLDDNELLSCFFSNKRLFGDIVTDSECPKACVVTEYVAAAEAKTTPERPVNSSNLLLKCVFDYPPSTKGTRAEEPIKTVYEEYFIWNPLAFIGTIGGTMGLFIGFSFHGAFDWMWDQINQSKFSPCKYIP